MADDVTARLFTAADQFHPVAVGTTPPRPIMMSVVDVVVAGGVEAMVRISTPTACAVVDTLGKAYPR